MNQYTKNRDKIVALEAELSGQLDDKDKARRLQAQIQALEDSNARLSIAPLLEAGEFSTISESLTEADQAMRNGRIVEYLSNAVDKLPGGAKEAVRYGVIMKDTALFQGLNRAVQYGDFISKAVLYDHLTQRKGYSKEDALKVIFEEFVPYNRLAGRGRDFLESMGLLWFYNYKLRIMKIAINTMRERPFTALVSGAGISPFIGADTVFSGSLAGRSGEGNPGLFHGS